MQSDAPLLSLTFIFHTYRVICMHDGSRLVTSGEETNLRNNDWALQIVINKKAFFITF